MIELETPEQIPQIPLPQDHKRSEDELTKIRKELHSINVELTALVKILGKRGR
jgi:hypothetical protein